MDIEDTVLCGVYVPCILKIYLWRSLCTLYIYGGYTSGGVYVPCILRMYLWWRLCTVHIKDLTLAELMYLVYIYMEDVPLLKFMYLVY